MAKTEIEAMNRVERAFGEAMETLRIGDTPEHLPLKKDLSQGAGHAR